MARRYGPPVVGRTSGELREISTQRLIALLLLTNLSLGPAAQKTPHVPPSNTWLRRPRKSDHRDTGERVKLCWNDQPDATTRPVALKDVLGYPIRGNWPSS